MRRAPLDSGESGARPDFWCCPLLVLRPWRWRRGLSRTCFDIPCMIRNKLVTRCDNFLQNLIFRNSAPLRSIPRRKDRVTAQICDTQRYRVPSRIMDRFCHFVLKFPLKQRFSECEINDLQKVNNCQYKCYRPASRYKNPNLENEENVNSGINIEVIFRFVMINIHLRGGYQFTERPS